MNKNADAFRTISEVAGDLDLPQHVLRFWETRFSQIKPLKRAGGRRFYRPTDVQLLLVIRQLLYGEGYTIKGVQRLLKEQGVKALQSGARPDEPEFSATVGTGGAAEASSPPGDAAHPDAERGSDEVPPAAAWLSPVPQPSPDERQAVAEALRMIDDCEAILRAARHSPS